MTVEGSSIRKCTQLNFDKKFFVFDWTRTRHICETEELGCWSMYNKEGNSYFTNVSPREGCSH